jgi:hypothetical protein
MKQALSTQRSAFSRAVIESELLTLEKLARAFLADARRFREKAVRIPGRRPKALAPIWTWRKKHCRIFEHEKE